MRKNIKLRRKIELNVKVIIIMIVTVLSIENHLSKEQSQLESLSESSTENCHRINFQGLSQETIPTGCESVSAVSILNYYGIDITPEQFIEEYLPKQGFYRSNGLLYGPDPNEYFAGDPFQKSSLGCFSNVIHKACLNMQEDEAYDMAQLQIQNVSGTSLTTLAETYVANDIPVLIWVTMGMKESKEGMRYLLEDGSTYTWTAGEHCVVLCGFDEENYYIMDPLENGQIVGYPKGLVEKRYSEMNKNTLVFLTERQM